MNSAYTEKTQNETVHVLRIRKMLKKCEQLARFGKKHHPKQQNLALYLGSIHAKEKTRSNKSCARAFQLGKVHDALNRHLQHFS